MVFNKKIIVSAAALAIIALILSLWFLVLSKKEAPDIEREIIAPKEETTGIDEFLEFPEEARPLLQDSLDEALSDIEALEL